MLYVHDIWVNWFEGAIKPYEVCEFHEWGRDDVVNLIDQMPLLLVKEGFYDYVEDGMNELPEDLIETVRGRARVIKNGEVELHNMFVITDGKRILAVDMMHYQTPVKKSKLVPRQESLVLEIIRGDEPIKFEYETIVQDEDLDWSLPPSKTMLGLSRRERTLKAILFEVLGTAHAYPDLPRTKYWFSEWNNGDVSCVEEASNQEILQILINEISEGWTEKHLNLLKVVVKGEDTLEGYVDFILEGGS